MRSRSSVEPPRIPKDASISRRRGVGVRSCMRNTRRALVRKLREAERLAEERS